MPVTASLDRSASDDCLSAGSAFRQLSTFGARRCVWAGDAEIVGKPVHGGDVVVAGGGVDQQPCDPGPAVGDVTVQVSALLSNRVAVTVSGVSDCAVAHKAVRAPRVADDHDVAGASAVGHRNPARRHRARCAGHADANPVWAVRQPPGACGAVRAPTRPVGRHAGSLRRARPRWVPWAATVVSGARCCEDE